MSERNSGMYKNLQETAQRVVQSPSRWALRTALSLALVAAACPTSVEASYNNGLRAITTCSAGDNGVGAIYNPDPHTKLVLRYDRNPTNPILERDLWTVITEIPTGKKITINIKRAQERDWSNLGVMSGGAPSIYGADSMYFQPDALYQIDRTDGLITPDTVFIMGCPYPQ